MKISSRPCCIARCIYAKCNVSWKSGRKRQSKSILHHTVRSVLSHSHRYTHVEIYLLMNANFSWTLNTEYTQMHALNHSIAYRAPIKQNFSSSKHTTQHYSIQSAHEFKTKSDIFIIYLNWILCSTQLSLDLYEQFFHYSISTIAWHKYWLPGSSWLFSHL